MKKILLLFTLFAIKVFSQPVVSGTMTLFSVRPYQVCNCDSIQIGMKFKRATYSTYLDTNYKFPVKFSYQQDSVSSNTVSVTIANFKYSDFYHLSKKLDTIPGVGIDTVYSFWYHVSCDFVVKHGGFYNQGSRLAEMDFHGIATVFVRECITGIEVYSLGDKQNPIIYYDLLGTEIEKRYNELIIQLHGRTRTKIIIQK